MLDQIGDRIDADELAAAHLKTLPGHRPAKLNAEIAPAQRIQTDNRDIWLRCQEPESVILFHDHDKSNPMDRGALFTPSLQSVTKICRGHFRGSDLYP